MMRALLDTDSPDRGTCPVCARACGSPPPAQVREARDFARHHLGGLRRFGRDRPDRFTIRTRWAVVFVVLAVLAIAARLVVVHTVESKTLAAQAAAQREFTQVLTAKRGAILDRNGRPLAYTDEARALTFLPQAVRAATGPRTSAIRNSPMRPPGSRRRSPGGSSALGGSISEADLLAKLNGQDKFVYLARSVATDVAARIVADYPEVGADPEDLRVYPAVHWPPTSSVMSITTATV